MRCVLTGRMQLSGKAEANENGKWNGCDIVAIKAVVKDVTALAWKNLFRD